MIMKRSIIKAATILVTLLSNPVLVTANEAMTDSGSTQDSAAVPPPKVNFKEIVRKCHERQKTIQEKIDHVISTLDNAGKSADISTISSAVESARATLSQVKDEQDKSACLLEAVHKHVDKVQRQLKKTREEHEKTQSLLDDQDPDWGEIIWAY